MLTAWWSFWQNILNIHLWHYELNVGIIYIYIKGHKKYIKVQQTTQMRTGLALAMNIVGCNTTTQRRTGPIHIRCISPWYNCTGWLGVKHQLTYYPWALLAATPHKWQLVLSYPWVLPLAMPKPRSIAQLSSSKRSCCSVVFQKILLQCGVPKDLVAVVFQKILLQWCSRRSCCCGVPDLVAVVFQKILLLCGVPDLVAVVLCGLASAMTDPDGGHFLSVCSFMFWLKPFDDCPCRDRLVGKSSQNFINIEWLE